MYLYSVRYSDHNRNKKLLKIPYLVHISTETTVVWPKVAQTKEFVLRCGIIVAEKFFFGVFDRCGNKKSTGRLI